MTVKTCDWRNPLHPSPSLPEHWQEERDEPSPRSSPALLRSPSSPPSWSPSPSPPPPPPPGPPSSSSLPLPPPPQRMVGRMSERLGSVGWNEELRFIFFLPNISVLNIGAHVLCSCVSSRVIVHNGHCAFKLALGHKTIAVNSFQFVRLFFNKSTLKLLSLMSPKQIVIRNHPKGSLLRHHHYYHLHHEKSPSLSWSRWNTPEYILLQSSRLPMWGEELAVWEDLHWVGFSLRRHPLKNCKE